MRLLPKKAGVDVANHGITEGVGARALIDGAWGFAATADVRPAAIERAIEEARKNATTLAKARGKQGAPLRPTELSREDFVGEGFAELRDMSVADKLGQVVRYEQDLAKASTNIQTARCRYTEYIEEKAIVTSDGAACSLKVAQPEISVTALAERQGERASSQNGAGVNGGWQCLFRHPALGELVDQTAKVAVDLLDAPYAEGGRKTVILAPAVVGLLCHEAVGHTVEADFVKAGSIAQGKIGQQVASELVTMADTGKETIAGYAVGNLPFDDEGVPTENTVIIENGYLKSYLHNRESAAEFGVAPTRKMPELGYSMMNRSSACVTPTSCQVSKVLMTL